MPIFKLSKNLWFPSPELAEDGLLALGGDLSRERLLLAYQNGIFPWFAEDEPILWWSPDPRIVFFPGQVHVSRRLGRTLRTGGFECTFDRDFEGVIQACAGIARRGEQGTWLSPRMATAYIALHRAGHAHSLECWRDGALAGGLYGVSLGGAFFGESMFSRVPDASKVALAMLSAQLHAWGFVVIDAQVSNPHLRRMGAREISRAAFMALLERSRALPSRPTPWTIEVRMVDVWGLNAPEAQPDIEAP